MIHDDIKIVRDKPIKDFCYKRFVFVKEDTPIEEILEKFNKLHSAILPVLDDDGKLVGKIRKSDLLKLFVHPKNIPHEHIVGGRIDFGYIALHASDIMGKYGAVATEDLLVYEAVLMMVKHHLTSMPVVDENEKLVGILCGDSIIAKSLQLFNEGKSSNYVEGKSCPFNQKN
ncbi:MAG: CBS domain-containing protein [Candidatus Diapherotrites archaeon]|nr:CBS domain-containing protein [Candidatus Diapherotrites archaeon]